MSQKSATPIAAEHQDGGEHARGVEHALRAQDDVAETALRGDELADDRADQRERRSPTFMPANSEGSAHGKRMRQSVARRPPRSERARSRMSGGTDFRPSTVSMTIANTAIRKAMAIFGSAPVPSQMTNSGATATLRHAVQPDDQRIDALLQQARLDDQHREQHADDHGEREAAERDEQRVPGVTEIPARLPSSTVASMPFCLNQPFSAARWIGA